MGFIEAFKKGICDAARDELDKFVLAGARAVLEDYDAEAPYGLTDEQIIVAFKAGLDRELKKTK